MTKYIVKEIADHLQRTHEGMEKDKRKLKSVKFFVDGYTWNCEIKFE